MDEHDSNRRAASSEQRVGGQSLLAARRSPLAINAADRTLIRRFTLGAAALFLFTAAFTRLDLLYSHKFFDVTGRAQWIWTQTRLSSGVPVAYFATRDFDLPANRYFTRIKIAGDPQYTLYFNGREVGGRWQGAKVALDVYDVSSMARTGRNRIVVAVRSANGVGGLIASVDIAPEYQNMLVTGSDWRIVQRWRDDLPLRDPPRTWSSSPMVLGAPPIGRWNFLSRRAGTFTLPIHRLITARQVSRMNVALPVIDIKGGVAVAGSRPMEGIVFDFGPTSGRPRLTNGFEGATRAVKVRFANDRSELLTIEGGVDSFVFAAGERTIVDPQERHFRYAMVYGGNAAVDLVQ
jgi:hypothetical protein